MSSFDDKLKANWKIFKGKAKENWAELTDDDLLMADAKWDQFVGAIQKKTGETRDKIEDFFKKTSNMLEEGADGLSNIVDEGIDDLADSLKEGVEGITKPKKPSTGNSEKK